MKKTRELHELRSGQIILSTVFTLALVLSLWLFAGIFSFVSRAESAARVTSQGGAIVRSSASTGGNAVTSYEKGAVISIRGQVQGSDGYTWYEVWADANTLGYIRSDLVEITDGSTPPAASQAPAATQQPPAATQQPPAATQEPTATQQPAASTQQPESGTGTDTPEISVTKVNPVSAIVKGSDNVRIRSMPSTSAASQILTTVQSGLALTVIGQVNGSDGKLWWQVSFISNGTEVTGFIRSDYAELSEEPTPYTEPEPEPEPSDDAEPETPAPAEEKPYDTVLYDGQWRLVVTETNDSWTIDDILETIQGNKQALEELEKSKRSQTIAIIILIILLVVAGGAVAYLIFKIRDMEDSAYFSQVENETIRRRNAMKYQRNAQSGEAGSRGGSPRPAGGQGQRPAGASQGQRPAGGQGQRPAGASQGQRPAGGQGQRPAGAPQGHRPAGTPQGQRPAGAPQGQRPAGASQGQRPAGAPQGQRPAGAPQDHRPAGTPQGQRPAGASQGHRPAGTPQSQRNEQSQSRPQPKNFMTEDEDEFDFEFLNYDGDHEQ